MSIWVAEILPKLSQNDRRALAQWTGDVLKKKIPDDGLEDEILIALQKGEVERMYTGIERAFDYEYNKGRKEGHESGLEQGKSLEKREMARRLLALGVDPETVKAASGLSEEQIHEDVVPYLAGAEGQR